MRAQKLYSAWNEGEEHSGIGKQHIGDAGSGGLMPEDGRAAAHKLNIGMLYGSVNSLRHAFYSEFFYTPAAEYGGNCV